MKTFFTGKFVSVWYKPGFDGLLLAKRVFLVFSNAVLSLPTRV